MIKIHANINDVTANQFIKIKSVERQMNEKVEANRKLFEQQLTTFEKQMASEAQRLLGDRVDVTVQ
jgi:hypothetical protein